MTLTQLRKLLRSKAANSTEGVLYLKRSWFKSAMINTLFYDYFPKD